jgi:TPP-dependent pyruvate/acetoin dehydrogenase alpha subunit
MTTSVGYASSGTFKDRVEGFGLKYFQVEGSDYFKVYDTLKTGKGFISENQKPVFIEVLTHRFCGHSKSDSREYIPIELDDYWKKNDFLIKLERDLGQEKVKEVSEKVRMQINEAYTLCSKL